MGMGGGNNGGAMADINITPMVDVMLVLLILFMVTAPMMNQGVEIDLPHATGVSIETQDDQLIISIDRELNYYINENKFTADELGPKLTAIAEANPGKPVFVRADGEVAYKHVAGLLGKVKMAGMPKVGLVFKPGEEEDAEDEEGD